MRIFLTVLLLAGCASYAHSQRYFIVVGAYASKGHYSEGFVTKLGEGGVKAFYVEDHRRHLLLVCIEKFDEFTPSINEMLAVRKKGKFPEAWVRILKEGEGIAPLKAAESVAIVQESAPVAENTTPPQQAQQQAQQPVQQPVAQSPGLSEVKEPVESTTVQSQPVTVVIPEQQPEAKESKEPRTLKNTPVLFHLYDANDNDKIVEGNIEIVDTQRARLIKSSKSSDTVSIPNPNSDSGMISLITDVFGYRKIHHEINYKTPVMDTSKQHFDIEGDYFVARFEMVRYHKGDIATLYHVFFFNDAAIMMPESKYELIRLLDMMKSNPRYRIMLNGHTNGNSRGRILSMGPSKQFFSLNAPDVKEGSGSSKELSGQRAELIRDWLMDQGIAADRMEVKAWGGTRMIHDKNSNNARKNVRVEIEVLAE
jgi:outer membrane protein OmpA-like peptidoglycan-associated protein